MGLRRERREGGRGLAVFEKERSVRFFFSKTHRSQEERREGGSVGVGSGRTSEETVLQIYPVTHRLFFFPSCQTSFRHQALKDFAQVGNVEGILETSGFAWLLYRMRKGKTVTTWRRYEMWGRRSDYGTADPTTTYRHLYLAVETKSSAGIDIG